MLATQVASALGVAVSARMMASAAAPVRPKVFFDCTIGGQAAGRIEFELFSDVVVRYDVLHNSYLLLSFLLYRLV